MTPEWYLRHIERLVADQQWQRVLAFASESADEVSPPLSADDLDRVQGLLEVAANIAHLDATASTDTVETVPRREAVHARHQGGAE
jgi:hypothetical protein